MADVDFLTHATMVANGVMGIMIAAVLWTLPHRASRILAPIFTIGAFFGFIVYYGALADPFSATRQATGAVSDIVSPILAFAGLAFMYVYPERPRIRWEQGLFAVGALYTVYSSLVFAFPDVWLHDVPQGVDFRTTARYYWSSSPGGLIYVGLLVLWLRRAKRHQGEERQPAVFWTAASGWVVAEGLAWNFTLLYHFGFRTHQFWPLHCATSGDAGCFVYGDPYLLTAGVQAVAMFGGGLAYLTYTAWKRTFLPLALFGVALLIRVVNEFSTADFNLLWGSINGFLFLWVVTEHNFLGAKPFGRIAAWAVASGFGISIFFSTFALGLSLGEGSFALGAAMVASLVIAASAAALILRKALGMQARDPDPSTTRSRVEPYHAMLAHELASGTSEEQAFAKLKTARASLGVSDHEHSLLALATSRKGGGQTTLSLQSGARFLDRYTVQQTLRSGGAGVAHLCKDEKLNRLVVIKTLRPETAAKQAVDELLREARAQGTVAHPNVVTLLDADRVGDQVFLVMEYVDGGSLADRLTGKPLPLPALRSLARDLTSALSAVHNASLVHRDVKPANIFLAKDGKAKLGDFGIAHLRGFETTVVAGPSTAIGTLRYMSPEQARGLPPRAPSDLWGAAVTLYEAAAGKPYLKPREGETSFTLQARVAGLGTFEDKGSWTPAQRTFWRRALHPEPAKRYHSAAAMGQAFAAAWP